VIHEAADGITRIDHPDLITIFVGANDMSKGADVAGFQSELDAILAHLHDSTDAFIVIGTLPDLTQLPSNLANPNPDVTEARVAQFNDVILNEAAKFDVAVADLRTIPNTGDITASDGYHPNNEGYARIAAVFLSIIDPHFFGQAN
jgi:lysophospholipase L1-like esterase